MASVAQAMRTLIEGGLLASGARLPSVREAALRHGVSPGTVVAAYDLLQGQGWIEARPQRGFFVRTRTSPARAIAASEPVVPVDATALIRGMFTRHGRRAGPGSGTLPPEWLDPGLLQRGLRQVLQADATAGVRYGEPAGDPALREALVRRLADLGVPASPEHVITTCGATHALDVVARTLLQPGDAVLVDEPGWAVEFARLSRMGMRLLPVPRGATGPDLAVMAHLARTHRPRLYVTVSVLHNPTGLGLALHHAHQVLQLAEAHGFLIAEDDSYAWLAPAHSPRLCALDGLRRTLYVGGFSKVLAPDWRVGFLAAPAPLVDRLLDTKLIGSLTTPSLFERALAWCLEQGALRRHAERVTHQLEAARSRSVRHAQAAGCRFAAPPAGLFGWVDTGVDTDVLAQRMAADDWPLAPGSLFLAARQPSRFMRINFATSQEPAFWRAFVRAREAAPPL